ncbi:Rqc2 family fibronectin-binding protein [Paenibacillus thermotolerans]|uniref:Rqc2 family fibronectin-binding protein n=1 Tax=Paenibacillus thermotolerans TaxID=3027807 RepID=UPI002367E79D|nr:MULTISPECIES: NFACT RNA binding domain-containing protein [unclassified Paenibacillus]
MSYDGLVVRAVVHEMQSFVGGRIHKIHQPNEHELVWTLRGGGTTAKWLLSANPTYPRVHRTERSYQNPLEAPMFCMLLRKYCENGVIESIEQVGMERIIHIHVRQRDELGDVSSKRIVIELTGRHSNIVLTDPSSGTVLDAIHRVTPAISSYRIIVPGSPYVAPPEQDKRNPLDASPSEVTVRLHSAVNDGAALTPDLAARALVDGFTGISPLAARAIAERAVSSLADGEYVAAEAAAHAFVQTMEAIRSHRYEPNIVVQERTGKSYFSVVPLLHIRGERKQYQGISECLEQYYGDKAERDAVKQKTHDLHRFLQNERNKNEKKLEKLRETLNDAQDADRYRIQGELLNAYMHTFERGAAQVEVVNYYDEEQRSMTIELDPLLTPSENAQRYFKKYQKMKNSLTAVEEQMEEASKEIRYLEDLLQQLDDATLADIEEIRAELVEGGYVRSRGGRKEKKARPGAKPQLHGFVSSEGVTIYVGKNNTQNDYITNRLAHPSDTWLHTKDIPGSHVLIRGDRFGQATLDEAANLAAYFSKAKSSSSVPVDYTQVRHVRKPSGAKPGFVIYERQKTIYITPDEEKVKAMSAGKQQG